MHMETILKRCAATVEDLSKKEIPQAAWKNCAGVAIVGTGTLFTGGWR